MANFGPPPGVRRIGAPIGFGPQGQPIRAPWEDNELLAQQLAAHMAAGGGPLPGGGPLIYPVPGPRPSIANAPHMGELIVKRDYRNANQPMLLVTTRPDEITSQNMITFEDFEDGDEVVVLERARYDGGFKHVFKRAGLEQWLINNPINPATRRQLRQEDIERFTLRILPNNVGNNNGGGAGGGGHAGGRRTSKRRKTSRRRKTSHRRK
jgi:hypothetical protein